MGKYFKTKGKGVLGKDHRTKTITRGKWERVKKMFPAYRSDLGKRVVYFDKANMMVYTAIHNADGKLIPVRKNLNKYSLADRKFMLELYGLDKEISPTMEDAHNILTNATEDNSGEEVKNTSGAIKSDGGKSDYYKITLPQWLLDKHSEKGFIMLEDLAEVIFDNDFNFTNVFKAQKRMFELKNGRGKEGNTFEYDATKVKYYVDKQVEVFSR